MFPTLKDNPGYSSVIDGRHYDRLMGYLADAKAKGAEIVELESGARKISASNRSTKFHIRWF